MGRRASLVLAVLGIGAGLEGCSSELTDRRAAQDILEHYRSVAPSFDWVDAVIIESVLHSNENEREVAFRFVNKKTEDGTAVTDTSRTYRVAFVRSNVGWTLARYGPEMTEAVAALVYMEAHEGYEPLLDALGIIRDARSSWQMSTGRALSGGEPTHGELTARVADTFPEDMQWGRESEAGGGYTY